MTKNQIEYAKLQETKRANLANEAITSSRDRANVQLGYAQLQETGRHNLVQESETAKHNRVVESQALVDLGIKAAAQRETERSNKAKEAETHRSNVAKEQETHRTNVVHENETIRSNLAREAETNRANVAKETETRRHNINTESIDRSRVAVENRKVDLGYAQAAETHRHNVATESQESVRLTNQMNETTARVNLLEAQATTEAEMLPRKQMESAANIVLKESQADLATTQREATAVQAAVAKEQASWGIANSTANSAINLGGLIFGKKGIWR